MRLRGRSERAAPHEGPTSSRFRRWRPIGRPSGVNPNVAARRSSAIWSGTAPVPFSTAPTVPGCGSASPSSPSGLKARRRRASRHCVRRLLNSGTLTRGGPCHACSGVHEVVRHRRWTVVSARRCIYVGIFASRPGETSVGCCLGRVEEVTKTAKSAMDLVAEANREVETLTAEQALARLVQPDALLVDVREGEELARTGSIVGAVHVGINDPAKVLRRSRLKARPSAARAGWLARPTAQSVTRRQLPRPPCVHRGTEGDQQYAVGDSPNSASADERKFLVVHAGWSDCVTSKRRLMDGLVGQFASGKVRVRLDGERAWLAVKGERAGSARPEFEIPRQEEAGKANGTRERARGHDRLHLSCYIYPVVFLAKLNRGPLSESHHEADHLGKARMPSSFRQR